MGFKWNTVAAFRCASRAAMLFTHDSVIGVLKMLHHSIKGACKHTVMEEAGAGLTRPFLSDRCSRSASRVLDRVVMPHVIPSSPSGAANNFTLNAYRCLI